MRESARPHVLHLAALGCAAAVTLACARPAAESAPAPASAPAAPVTSVATRVVFLGDSLTAGYGLPEDEAFPAVLERALLDEGIRIDAVNAGVSGDTTAGGLRRLDWVMRGGAAIVVVGLGANDGLRGQPVSEVEANLRAIVEAARAKGAEVLLLGMKMPPNYGSDYTRRFEAVYPKLATELGVPLVPFMLEGVAARPELNLEDGIHPNAEGQRRVADVLLPHLRLILER